MLRSTIVHKPYLWLSQFIPGLSYHTYVRVYLGTVAGGGCFGQGWVIASHIILWDVVVFPCVGCLLLVPGSSCAMCMIVQHIIDVCSSTNQ